MHCAGRAHDGACDLVRHTLWNSAGINGWGNEVLSVSSFCDQAGVDALLAIVLATIPAVLTVTRSASQLCRHPWRSLLPVVADIHQWFDASSVSNVPTLDALTHFDDYTSTLKGQLICAALLPIMLTS